MSNYMIYDKDSYISHHGVKGQQWGVQNGPPYPLDPQKITDKRTARKTLRKHNTQTLKYLDQLTRERTSTGKKVANALVLGNVGTGADIVDTAAWAEKNDETFKQMLWYEEALEKRIKEL